VLQLKLLLTGCDGVVPFTVKALGGEVDLSHLLVTDFLSLQAKRRQVGADSLGLLEWLEPLGAEIREAKGVALLREVLAQGSQPDAASFITSVVTQRATQSDDAGLPATLQKQQALGLERPKEL